MRLFSVIIYTYFYSNSATVFFGNLRWMPSGPNDLLTFNFLSSSISHTQTKIERERERNFFEPSVKGGIAPLLSGIPPLQIYSSSSVVKTKEKNILKSICNILIFSDCCLISWGTCWFLWLPAPDTLQH